MVVTVVAARLPCIQEVTRLHAELATVYAAAIRAVASGSGLDLEGMDAFSGEDAVGGLDAVGSHGQTVLSRSRGWKHACSWVTRPG